MRRNILIIISFLTLLVSSGCTNLDEKWYSEVTPDTYFTSKETVYSFLVRSFTHWRWFHGFDRAILQECTTDEMVSHKKEYITMMSDIPNCSITTGHLFTPTTKKPGVG